MKRFRFLLMFTIAFQPKYLLAMTLGILSAAGAWRILGPQSRATIRAGIGHPKLSSDSRYLIGFELAPVSGVDRVERLSLPCDFVFWNLSTLETKHLFTLPKFPLGASTAFSPDGRQIAVSFAEDSGTIIRIWDRHTWKEQEPIRTQMEIKCIYFDADLLVGFIRRGDKFETHDMRTNEKMAEGVIPVWFPSGEVNKDFASPSLRSQINALTKNTHGQWDAVMEHCHQKGWGLPNVTISRDGRICIWGKIAKFTIEDLTTGNSRELSLDPERNYEGPMISADGRFLAIFASPRPGWYSGLIEYFHRNDSENVVECQIVDLLTDQLVSSFIGINRSREWGDLSPDGAYFLRCSNHLTEIYDLPFRLPWPKIALAAIIGFLCTLAVIWSVKAAVAMFIKRKAEKDISKVPQGGSKAYAAP